MPTNPSKKPTPQEKASLSVSRATYGARRWLRSYWPVLYFAAMTFLVAVAIDFLAAFVFAAGTMLGALMARAWA